MKSPTPILPLVLALLTLTGCVTRGYKLADKSVPPAVPLNLTSSPIAPAGPSPQTGGAAMLETPPPAAEVMLHSVIVYQGPGSWKREAYWDEYVLSLTNRGEAPLVITAASLSDGKSEPLAPGANPWALEKLSKKWWESNAARQAGTYLALGAGAATGVGVMYVAVLSSGIFAPLTGGAAVAVGVGAATAVALPIVAGGTVFMNIHRKHQVEAEFTRRRLVLPLTLAPGQTAQGSLFFRLTPSPQRLALQGRVGSESRDVVIDLAPLAGLHLKPATTAPTAGDSSRHATRGPAAHL